MNTVRKACLFPCPLRLREARVLRPFRQCFTFGSIANREQHMDSGIILVNMLRFKNAVGLLLQTIARCCEGVCAPSNTVTQDNTIYCMRGKGYV